MTREIVNGLGMRLVRVEPGTFWMGQADGDYDERPVHRVRISRPFYMGATEVTNAQYERFDPEHRVHRGQRGLSAADDEPATFVSWHDAVRFCAWLSEREGVPYRLPTEAEWEYACRAGTDTAFNAGETLPDLYHRQQEETGDPRPVPLPVGITPSNAFGLYDMHGNVEEWCHDWYGPYVSDEQTDPVGYEDGEFKVTRGGSHNTELVYLRSANRSGTLPEDKHWLIGFRVVQGEPLAGKPLGRTVVPGWAADVAQDGHPWFAAAEGAAAGRRTQPRTVPYFYGPIPYVVGGERPESIPMYGHNHCPSVTWCDNGDLLAVWFSCNRERGREMTILGSRLRAGAERWDTAAEFFKAPDRNMTGSALFNDGQGRLFFFNGLETDAMWRNLALVMRTSTDNGATWSKPELINPHHQPGNQVISGTSITEDGVLLQPCDAVSGGAGGTVVHMSRDGGATWSVNGVDGQEPEFAEGKTGSRIAGIHAGVVSLKDGSLLALGRGNSIDGRMPLSVSRDMGASWTYAASPFPPIGSAQRLVLMRLREGPLLFVSFTDQESETTIVRNKHYDGKTDKQKFIYSPDRMNGIRVRDAEGKERTVYGMYAALSYDDGRTWPVCKPVTPGGGESEWDGGGHTGMFRLTDTLAEPMGYLAATQAPDGTIHLLGSRLHYRFNLAWLEQPMDAEATGRSDSVVQ